MDFERADRWMTRVSHMKLKEAGSLPVQERIGQT